MQGPQSYPVHVFFLSLLSWLYLIQKWINNLFNETIFFFPLTLHSLPFKKNKQTKKQNKKKKKTKKKTTTNKQTKKKKKKKKKKQNNNKETNKKKKKKKKQESSCFSVR